MKIPPFVILSVALLALLSGAASAQGFLHASGTQIVNGNGNAFMLKGMGLGGWLVPEGYMILTPGSADSPSRFRSSIAALIGDSNTTLFFQRYRRNYINRRDIDSIAHWGFNAVRLPMLSSLLTPRGEPGVYLEEGFAIIDSLLSWCEANHLYLILDLHCAPGAQNPANHSDYDAAYPMLWESDVYKSQTVDLWKTLATRYATKQWIGGYDILNEPAYDLGAGNVPLRNLYIDITNAIRSVDTNHILLVEGNWWATDFSGLTPPWDANMAYSFHKYWSTTDQGSINTYTTLRSTYGVPLWLGESGENSNMWFAEIIALMQSNGIGWSWWTHKKMETVVGPVSAFTTQGYSNILRYWNQQGPKPAVVDAINGLNSMADNLSIERCTIHPDVLDAILRQPLTDATRPFTDNSIPGIIYATDYDLGKNQFAYADADYENTTGSATWNNGWAYRNDGVDIETCSDFPSNGYNVGWINSGEFLNFTAHVAQSGTYQVALRAAANASGGKVILKRNGVSVTGALDVPLSGGWQAWEDVDLGRVSLTAGTETIGLYLYFGGFNVNYLQFTFVPAAVDHDPGAPADFALRPNYPNPFNPVTSIRYELPKTAHVTLTVFDLLGRPLETLVDGREQMGYHAVTWDAKRYASGVYVCRLTAGSFSSVRKMMLIR